MGVAYHDMDKDEPAERFQMSDESNDEYSS